MTAALAITLLIAVVGVLAGAGAALHAFSRRRLRLWAEQRLRGGAAPAAVVQHAHRLAIVAAGAATAATVIAGFVAGSSARGPALPLALLLTAVLLAVAGHAVPRAIGRRARESTMSTLLGLLQGAERVLAPVATLAARFAGRNGAAAQRASARAAIAELLREGELEGVMARDETVLIAGIAEFGDKPVGEIGTPRERIFALPTGLPARELATRVAASQYGRVPVYRGSLDDIVGMVHAFDVLRGGGDKLLPIRPVTTTTPSVRCNELLLAMLRESRHLAIVRDERGRTMRLVTLEDLLEELVGDIRDEHDEPAPAGTAA